MAFWDVVNGCHCPSARARANLCSRSQLRAKSKENSKVPKVQLMHNLDAYVEDREPKKTSPNLFRHLRGCRH